MDQIIQVMTTTDSERTAAWIARTVVEKRVAACAQVYGPITSTYWWEETIETATEWLCLMKSRQELYPQLEAAITEAHTYDVPEILVVPVTAGNPTYIDWVRQETQSE
ncbi:MAG TPA: divalent-cation tolerance protein CutA [Chloroflexota bacterium]